MTATQRQYVLLTVLVGALVVVLAKVIGVGDPAETTGQPSNQPQRPATSTGRAGDAVADLGLERLRGGREQLQPAERNPFRFRPKPPPPPIVREVARAPEVFVPPAPTGPPPPPPIPLKYIGFADEAGPAARVGVFSDGRGLVINAKEGDILEGRYRVLRVGTDSADLVYLDGRGRQTIRLSGQ